MPWWWTSAAPRRTSACWRGASRRESAVAVDVGGVRTNFRMPDVLAIGLGGGSLVRGDDTVTVGPDSVGFELTEKALVFGGDTLTATDVAVAAGLADIGDRSAVAGLDGAAMKRGLDTIHTMVEDAIDRMKTSAEPVPAILVGGGSILIERDLAGVSALSIPRAFGGRQRHRRRDRPGRRRGRPRLLLRAGGAGERDSAGQGRGRGQGGGRRRGSRQHRDHRGRGDTARLPAGRRLPGPGQGGRRSRRRLSGKRAGATARQCQR